MLYLKYKRLWYLIYERLKKSFLKLKWKSTTKSKKYDKSLENKVVKYKKCDNESYSKKR
jgi:hypothetical protein